MTPIWIDRGPRETLFRSSPARRSLLLKWKSPDTTRSGESPRIRDSLSVAQESVLSPPARPPALPPSHALAHARHARPPRPCPLHALPAPCVVYVARFCFVPRCVVFLQIVWELVSDIEEQQEMAARARELVRALQWVWGSFCVLMCVCYVCVCIPSCWGQ